MRSTSILWVTHLHRAKDIQTGIGERPKNPSHLSPNLVIDAANAHCRPFSPARLGRLLLPCHSSVGRKKKMFRHQLRIRFFNPSVMLVEYNFLLGPVVYNVLFLCQFMKERITYKSLRNVGFEAATRITKISTVVRQTHRSLEQETIFTTRRGQCIGIALTCLRKPSRSLKTGCGGCCFDGEAGTLA